MEDTNRFPVFDINSVYLVWCFALPVFVFLMALSLADRFWGFAAETGIRITVLREFLMYYENNLVREFLTIFLNNYMIALVLVYFTPVALVLRRVWEKWRRKSVSVSGPEKIVLVLFPGLFLARQAVNIAVISSQLAHAIDQNVLVTLAGIILPHGLPELAAFSLAGAIGMEVTRKLLFTGTSGRLVSGRVLGILLVLVALCAFVEVYFTPKVFAALMTVAALR